MTANIGWGAPTPSLHGSWLGTPTPHGSWLGDPTTAPYGNWLGGPTPAPHGRCIYDRQGSGENLMRHKKQSAKKTYISCK